MHPLKNIEAERARAGMTRKEPADSLNVTEQTLRMRASTAAVCSRRRLSRALRHGLQDITAKSFSASPQRPEN